MDANSGEPWSEADISDHKNEIAHGRTMAQTASFLCRDEDEVRQKARELGPAGATRLTRRGKHFWVGPRAARSLPERRPAVIIWSKVADARNPNGKRPRLLGNQGLRRPWG